MHDRTPDPLCKGFPTFRPQIIDNKITNGLDTFQILFLFDLFQNDYIGSYRPNGNLTDD